MIRFIFKGGRWQYNAVRIAKAVEDSEAAIAKIKETKISPIIPLKKTVPVKKFKLTASNKSSILIRVINIFFRFKATPNKPMLKRVEFTDAQSLIFISNTDF
jgi:hypothetical protein